MAYPVVTVRMGLGGRYRQRLINEIWVAGAWPLSEIVSNTARDITGNMHHGVYDDDIVRGVPLGLPEGGLGCTLDGTQQITIPHGDKLSLENGSADICVRLKTTTNDAVVRGIVVKHNGTNGYFLALYQGALLFNLSVAGSLVLGITRGPGMLSDGEWHTAHLCYEPEENRARIFIDGVQIGDEENASTEPQVVNTPLRIGGLIPTEGRFIGSLGYVMLGREGNPNLSVDLQATTEWTDVSDDVEITEPIRIRGGGGTGELDRMAGPGSCTFRLDNSHRNSAQTPSYYSIGHTDCRPGFTIGAAVEVSVEDPGSPDAPFVQFVGSVKRAPARAGENRERDVEVTAVDWLDVPARQPLSALPAEIGLPSHMVFWRLVDECDAPPHAVEYHPGGETLAYALDSAGNQMRILQEMGRVAASGQDYGYVRGDGTVVYEPRHLRRNDWVAEAQYDNTMLDVTVQTDEDAIVNIVRGEIVPRELDELATTVLFSQTNRQPISPGDTLVIEGQYRDPGQKAAPIGGIVEVTPVPNTDYTMTTSIGGNITADAELVFDPGGAGFRATITNNHATQVGYFRFEQIRGQGIKRFESILVDERDGRSIREHGPRDLTLSMPYQTSVLLARDVALQIIERRKDAKALPTTLVVGGATQVNDVLERTLGDRIEVIEEVTGLSDALQGSPLTPTAYYIQSKEVVIEAGPVLTATFGLAMAPSVLGLALWIVGVPGFAEVGLTTFVAPL